MLDSNLSSVLPLYAMMLLAFWNFFLRFGRTYAYGMVGFFLIPHLYFDLMFDGMRRSRAHNTESEVPLIFL